VPVRFTIEDAKTVLINAEEHRQTTRWENSFPVEDPELATGLRVTLQLRGVDDAGTKLHVNRTAQDAELTRDPLWGNYVVNLSSADLIQGGNRIEIVGGETGGIQDRFARRWRTPRNATRNAGWRSPPERPIRFWSPPPLTLCSATAWKSPTCLAS
jgi:hypothetical protein